MTDAPRATGRPGRTIAITAAAVLVSAVAVVASLWWWLAASGVRGADLATARLDALKVGFSIVVGSGGVAALYLAWRRQRSTEEALAHQMKATASTELDAEARRITDLYTKAADQLGSDKAPVRLAGLYALERLAQDNETQRQAVVNVLCAYLRMPFEPPAERDDDATPEEREEWARRAEESQVRLTVQHIFGDHLKPERDEAGDATNPLFWPDVVLDLTNATLMDFGLLRQGEVKYAAFGAARFLAHDTYAGAWFTDAVFLDGARFDRVEFTGPVDFSNARFGGTAWFAGASFGDGYVSFKGAEFGEPPGFEGALVLPRMTDKPFWPADEWVAEPLDTDEWARLTSAKKPAG
jgi:pentapeptide repeat protein